MCVADVRICSIDWDSFPFTDLTFHVADFFSISSLQCDYGLLRRLTLIWVIFRHSRISQGPRIHRSTDLPIHESTNHDPTNPRNYPRIHKHLHLAHHAQGKGKTCGVLHLSRIHESIHGFTSPQSTNPQIYESINPRIHKSMSQSSYLGVPPTPHCMLPTAFCTLYQGTRLALWCFASVKCFVIWLTFS